MKHEESTLHLKFCTWIKKTHPELLFTRHEREKQRSVYLQGLMKVYNSIDGLPDFELVEPLGDYYGLYIEFKKPGEKWLLKDGKTVKPQYAHQYRFHKQAWNKGRCAYFCNDLDIAKDILQKYITGLPIAKQEYFLPVDNVEIAAASFFDKYFTENS